MKIPASYLVASIATLFTTNILVAQQQSTKSVQPITIVSDSAATNWGDALISGNGRQGVMVHGGALDEKIVLNHEKLWVPAQPVKPDVPNMVDAVKRARELAREEKWSPAAALMFNGFGAGNKKMFPKEALIRKGPRFGLNYVHPALYLKVKTPAKGEVADYRRTLALDSGEASVNWTDERGDWNRNVFVSRPDNVVVMQIKRPTKTTLTTNVRFAARPGWNEEDIAAPTIEHRDGEIYLQTHYKHKHGLDKNEGYQVMARVIAKGGTSKVNKDSLSFTDADEVLLLIRTEFLPVAEGRHRERIRKELAALSSDYDELLASHAKVHGEIFQRVRYELGGKFGDGRTTEEIIAEAEANGPTPAYLELIFAVGRYSLISSSGELPPTLMGIWGDTWKPQWWGHYTNDSNLNLAISNGSVGNMPEMMDSYFGWIETLYPDWQRNAQQLYGARGYMGGIAHGWRHGLAIAGWNQWTGASGWLGAYFWQHYLFTGDKEFLANRVVPLLENVVLFYQDFLKPMESEDGKFLIYPCVSPENKSPNMPGAPNATSEIAIIRSTFTALIEAYRELGIKEDRIPELEAFLKKVPDYRINEDGAIAEWSYPGAEENYNHRHNSHLHAVYPGAHGYMELGFYGSRLQTPSIVWDMLDDYARSKFIYRSFVSSHNPNHRIYNLDSTLSLPAILTEMCLYSRPGELSLLPGIPEAKLPTGRIEGILARKGIVIQQLSWDVPNKKIILELTSSSDQTVVISSRLKIEKVESENAFQIDQKWNLKLAADQPAAAIIRLSDQ